jgi:ATP/maltotriose-dependent transcriptional regulator MalT
MRATAAVQSAGTFLRAGNRGRCREELEIARNVYQTLGAVEAEALAATEGAVAAIRGDWARALEAFVEDERAAMEAGYELLALQARGDQARIRLERGDDPGHLAELLEECRQARAPLIASYVRAFIERATLRISTSGPSDHSHPNSTLEERAFRADTAAIWSELKRENALGHWRQSLALWQRLGYSVWLARAQARCGDRAAAEHTLDVLDSPDEARHWALAE